MQVLDWPHNSLHTSDSHCQTEVLPCLRSHKSVYNSVNLKSITVPRNNAQNYRASARLVVSSTNYLVHCSQLVREMYLCIPRDVTAKRSSCECSSFFNYNI